MSLHQAEGLRARAPGRNRVGPPGAPRPGLLGIVSGKGGVGKSTLAVNLATACAARGASTLLVDGDAGLANADLLLGLVPRFTLADACAGRARLEDVVTRGPGGLELVVSGVGAAATSSLIEAARGSAEDAFGRLLRSRRQTLLDLGAGIGPGVIDLAVVCDPVWLVVTPEPTSLADAYTLARRLLERRPGLRIEVVVNRAPDAATGERTHQSLARLARRFLGRDLPLRAILPEDPAMLRAVARQEPLVLAEPRARLARRLDLLAESLLDDVSRIRPGILPG